MTIRLPMKTALLPTRRRMYRCCVCFDDLKNLLRPAHIGPLCAATALCCGVGVRADAQEKPPQAETPVKQAEKNNKISGKPGGKVVKAHISRKTGEQAQGGEKPQAKQDNQEPANAEEDLINADRPGIADGSQVIGPRRFQIEIGVEQDYLGGNGSTARLLTVPTLLRFGIDERYEFRVETSGYSSLSATDPQTGTTHADGMSPFSIGFKRQFQASKGPRHPSVGMIARLFPGSGGSVFATNHATGDVRLAADWDFAPKLSLNPNLGFGVYEDGAGRLYGTALLANTITYAPTTHLGFFVDFGLQTREPTAERASLIFDGGVTYIVGANVQLDVAVGTGASGRTTPHPFWTAGVSVRF